MARKSLKAGALTAPLPPVIVTVGTGESSNMITIAWTGILATHPPRTYISVRPSRHSYAMLKESGEFVINLPSADMARKVDYVGIYTGAKVDKFAVTGLTPVPSEHVSAPTVEECPVAIECRVCDVIPMGTHDVFVADILGITVDEKIMDKDGKLCFEGANLLAYAHGEYFALGERIGSFGFSTKKEKKPRARSASDVKKEDAGEKVTEKKPFYLSAPRKGGKKGGRKK